jgi:hypothetical protein
MADTMITYRFADLSCSDQSFDTDVHSPNEMLVDPEEYVVEPALGEKDDIAIINPDRLNSSQNDPEHPLATDCTLNHHKVKLEWR